MIFSHSSLKCLNTNLSAEMSLHLPLIKIFSDCVIKIICEYLQNLHSHKSEQTYFDHKAFPTQCRHSTVTCLPVSAGGIVTNVPNKPRASATNLNLSVLVHYHNSLHAVND
ncbi:avidin-like [Platysternon megacephalum]|uniref:Avidin-like n=1 Tax=Platysternon megacephalum TaxID=55544 RepID=A0A4D9DRU5_9SAUR|nr:avidin-like [Platysternon megacephalum]